MAARVFANFWVRVAALVAVGAVAVGVLLYPRAVPDELVLRAASVRAGFADNRPVVMITLKAGSRREFGNFTAQHTDRVADLIIDGKVVLSPLIREPITGGHLQIDSYGTVEEASMMAKQLGSQQTSLLVRVRK